MKRWNVCYSEHRIMEIIVEADSDEEAERMVMDGEVDYSESKEQDAEVTGVNSVEFDSDSGDDE
jgi:hypothetical protein